MNTPPIGRKLNILLAEDDSADCLLFKEALEELPVSAQLTTISNGEQLIKWLSKKGRKLPDVLFLDLNMPRKNGFASLGEIKRNPEWQDLPVIIFSTASDEAMIRQVYRDAAHYYIRKPNKFQELKDVLYKALVLVAERTLSLPGKKDFVLASESKPSPRETPEPLQNSPGKTG